MKLVIRFGKTERLRFISHLDLQRTFMFALSRSGLPIAYSQGFTPHPVMGFGTAMAMGWTSEYEIFEVRLDKEVTAEEGLEAFRRALPPDIPVLDAFIADNSRQAPAAAVLWADYRVTVKDAETIKGIEGLLERETIPAVRKSKSGEKEIDIRHLIRSLKVDGNTLYCCLGAAQTDMLRPELLLRTLRGEDVPCRVHRTSQLGVDEKGEIRPLMEIGR